MEETVFYLLMPQRYTNSNFKAKPYPLCLGNTSKDFAVNNIIKTILNGYVYDFSVGYNAFDISDIINIHKCFMKKLDVK